MLEGLFEQSMMEEEREYLSSDDELKPPKDYQNQRSAQKNEDTAKSPGNEISSILTSSRQPLLLVYTPQIDLMWLFLIGVAAGTRMLSLTNPSSVVFDEVHFGRFTSYFMQNKFFFDVHPPLGKLLFALVGYLSGFTGEFTFEQIGQAFGSYEGQIWCLRMLPATFSTLLVPCVYEILLELGCSYWMAIFGAVIVTFENMLVVQGRFILMDSILVFFIALSVLCYLKFLKESNRPFQTKWWLYLFCLSVALTGSFSVKYNGALTVILIGGFTFLDVWRLIGDTKLPAHKLWQHIVARAGCLCVFPILLYLLQFFILFSVLTNTGPHDDYMSSAFQRTLKGGLGKITEHQAKEVAYGSQITLRNTHKKKCWLHSHPHLYPVKYPDGRGSSAQQQVTCYGFKDVNNWWIVKHRDSNSLTVDFPPKYVKNGDIIHLVHGATGRGLNSHDVAAPMNAFNMEVSGYIDHNISMHAQLDWKLEILNPDSSNVWKVIESQIRLTHVNTSTSMMVTGALLPDWGFHQFEVANGKIKGTEESVWNAEEHNQNMTIPEGMDKSEVERQIKLMNSQDTHSPSFLSKFIELQTRMLKVNNELVQEHDFASRPAHWPFMLKGVAYWINDKSNAQVFCIGNPVVWWGGTLAVLGYLGLLVIYLLRRRRAIFDLPEGQWQLFGFIASLAIGGFVIHYFPFFPMERTLFIHHYLPALVFKMMLIPLLANHIQGQILRNYPWLQKLFGLLCVAFACLVVMSFKYFSPFTYGTPALSADDISQRKWISSWKFLVNHK